MRIINSNTDLVFNVMFLDKNDNKIGSEKFTSFTIKLFTDDPDNGIIYTLDEFEAGVLRIPSQELRTLHEGQIKIQANYSFADSNYKDSNFNDGAIRNTDYYLKKVC